MDLYDLWLSCVNISSKIKIELLKKFKTSKEVWYYCIENDMNLNNNIKGSLKDAWNKDKLEHSLENINNQNIKVVKFNDENYPVNLKKYSDAPFSLFYKGDIEILNKIKTVSVVGARNCTFYGIQCTKYIVEALTKNNIGIISGMAKGIDANAHAACIEAGGYTCAVLGCGIDIIYPKTNKEIYYSIIDKGCIVSEFLPGTPPYNYNFPIRNRIISGLGKILIVVEAGEKSGTLITANCALEQGKDVIVVPGSIFSPQSKGTNKLISEGAYPFVDIQDVFNLLKENYIGGFIEEKIMDKGHKSNEIHVKLSKLIGDSPIHIDDIIKICHIDISQLYDVLFEMQFNNEIMCLSGNYYVRIHNI
ncbi:DNA-processing protein DprA [Haloimpatiens lingqiaonensis]|uniref:DNA-processing protein DprA n=1 Tax=Haloimpatiens lingqiaonensis TaxID=1380675 RepID=UPI0010FDEF1B|nr:DNA-processing protein DprA [Haloimpatiens lingqiaonensis]